MGLKAGKASIGFARVMLFAALVITGLAVPAGAQAAFPGANGKISFFDYDTGQSSWINPDGSGEASCCGGHGGVWSPDGRRLAYDDGATLYTSAADGSDQHLVYDYGDYFPGISWSPDQSRLVFALGCTSSCDTKPNLPEIWVAQADGSSAGCLLCGASYDVDPVWSPDGSKIAFESNRDGNLEIYVMNADGSGQTRLTNSAGSDRNPDWSPDSSRIVFDSMRDGNSEIYSMRADGTGVTRLTQNSAFDAVPAWSPDGTKIAFERGQCFYPNPTCDIYVMSTDGVVQTSLGTNGAAPQWQPIPGNYIRPKAAAPVRVSLTPAYNQCNPALANRTHGPPLAFPACDPPSRASGHLTVGTPDANGAPAKSINLVRYGVHVGNPATPDDEADVRIVASITDVRDSVALVDYAGELQLDQTLRITDRDNSPTSGNPGPGTVIDTNFPVTIPCVPTADTTVGSTCAIDTTVEAIVPNAVKEGRRSVWELGQVKVYDGGSDGAAGTLGDNTLFMDEGLFVP
jgi:hypothetical protein